MRANCKKKNRYGNDCNVHAVSKYSGFFLGRPIPMKSRPRQTVHQKLRYRPSDFLLDEKKRVSQCGGKIAHSFHLTFSNPFVNIETVQLFLNRFNKSGSFLHTSHHQRNTPASGNHARFDGHGCVAWSLCMCGLIFFVGIEG